MTDSEFDFWPVADATAALQVSDKTLRKLRKDSGTTETIRDGKVYFDMNAVRRYIKENNLGFEEQLPPKKEKNEVPN
ncbi:MAG: hypothetical protein MI892_07295, partial [Desulfobacterales bacterium]|nr:hypothetical protein [Desulfobacterales bacterium]